MFRRTVMPALLVLALTSAAMAGAGVCDPVTFQNDQRLSDMGGLGNPVGTADNPAVAYNSTDQEFLAVWEGTEGDASSEPTKIYGQRIDAVRGAEVGTNDFLAAESPLVAEPADPDADATSPALAHNSTDNQYLVVFVVEEDLGGTTETEVYGQLLAADGSRVGSPFRVSDCGTDGDPSADVGAPFGYPLDVCYNATNNQYLVVWRCDDIGDNDAGTGAIVNGEFEIHGRIVNANGSTPDADFQISEVGGLNGLFDPYDAESPKCAWNSTANEYLVVFGADSAATGDSEREVYGQRLSNTGIQIGTNDFQISTTSHVGTNDSAVSDVAHCATTNQYLVVWAGDPVTNDVVDIYGRLVSAVGVPGTQFQIGQTTEADEPTVVSNGEDGEFLVVWNGLFGAGQREIFGQRVSSAGAEIGLDDLPISDLGPVGNTAYNPNGTTGLAWADTGLNSYYCAFSGPDNRDSQLATENEVFGQFVDPVLEITKTIVTADVTGVDAGDTVSYEIVVKHGQVDEGGDIHEVSLRDALNLDVTDDIPDLLEGTTLVSAEIDDGDGSPTDVSGSFSIDGSGDLTTTGDVDLLLFTNGANHEVLTIVVEAQVKDTASPADLIGNSGCVTWENTDSLVRAGYCATGSADDITMSGALLVSKTVSPTTATVGETVTYEIEVEVVEGTTTNIQLEDTLPTGLSYVGGSAAISNAGGMTISPPGVTEVGQILTLDIASAVNPGNVDNAAAVDTDSFFVSYQVTVDPGTAAGALYNKVDATADGELQDLAGPFPHNNVAELTVELPDTITTILSDDPDPSVTGQPFVVSFQVEPVPPATTTPTGNADVELDGVVVCTPALDAAGSGSCTVTPTTAGTKTVTVTYLGDVNYSTSIDTTTHVVNQADTTTTITLDSPDPSLVGAPVTVDGTVVVNAPGSGTPTGTVTVSDGVDSCMATLDAAGNFQCVVNLTTGGLRTLTATYSGNSDYNGSSDTEDHEVNQPPVAICQDVSVSADAGCQGVVTAGDVDNGSFDPEGRPLTLTLSPPGPYSLGDTVVTLTVEDDLGQTDSCTATVTVADNTFPEIACPEDIVVPNDPGQCGAVVTYTAPVGNDGCPGATTVLLSGLGSGALFPVGPTTVTYQVTDAGGNTAQCSFTVTVNDTEPPTLACPADIVVSNDPGVCGAVVSFADATASDNCPGVTVALTEGPASGSVFPVGPTLVTFTATDSSGNTAACSFTVTVNDTEPPTLACPVDIVVPNDPGECGAVVNFADATANDNCPGVTVALTSGPSSGSLFPVGVTTVSYTATDTSGNTDSCDFTVTVNDTEDPTIACPADITVPNDEGVCGAMVSYPDATASDNCPGVTVALTGGPASGSVFPVGPTLVTFTATDTSGNTAACSFTVTVNDTEDPTITCPADIVQPSDPGGCGAVISYAAPTVTDNCPGATAALTGGLGSGAFFPVGETIVIWTATDASGNTAACSFTVTVLNAAPVVGPITAPLDPVEVNIAINASATFTDGDVGQTHTAEWDWGDGSTSPGTVTEPSGADPGEVTGSHSYTEAGVYTITLTVTDECGDSDSGIYQFVVIYDPSAGFVTGGGKIDSPAGAYPADPTLTGPANFAFVAKYKKGKNTPDGNTSFRFRVADLDFQSNTYDWLVVAGMKAQYKGVGTIGGVGNFGFFLTAMDRTEVGQPDRFRIKIWDADIGEAAVVYDNDPGEELDADPTTEISNGNIVIHTGKKK